MLEKIFKAYDVRATYPEPLNEDAAWKVGYASGRFLAQDVAENRESGTSRPDTVAVSRDMRPQSGSLAEALIAGLRASGTNVVDLGECDTSFIYFAINHLGTVGGIQVTASHNPINYNGFKICGQLARPIGAESGLNTIRDIALSLTPREVKEASENEAGQGTIEQADLWAPYREHVLKFYTPPAHGRSLKVFVDGSNGMAGAMIPKVFDGVPGLDLIDLNFEHGPTVPFAHQPNPLVPENMVPTQEGVAEHKTDAGACFDGDADRCMFTDEKGQILGCDHLTALLARHFVKENADTTVIYDLRSSKIVEKTITDLGARPQKCRVGHVYMKQALRQTQGIFGGELSGHFYFRDNFYTDSGAIAFASVLSVLGQSDKTLSELIAPFQVYPQSGEINFEVEDKAGVIETLREKYADAHIDDLDGVTIDCFDDKGWWFNVRASNTEPLLRLNAEAKDDQQLQQLLSELKPMLGKETVEH